MKKTAIIIGVAALVFAALLYRKSDTYKYQKEISQNIIRFHVRANSDSEADQELKLRVKDAVVTYMQSILSEAGTLADARAILSNEYDNLEAISKAVIAENGYDYEVYVYSDREYFPVKMYGDLCFPPGEYEALRIDIGEKKGHNWWCVLYPSLCMVDGAYMVVPDSSKEKLSAVLTADAYNSLFYKEDTKYEFRFKYLTFLNKLF